MQVKRLLPLSVVLLFILCTSGTAGLTTLVSFNGENGSDPIRNLVRDSMGNLYGTTSGGGTYGYGTVFKVESGSGKLSTLASFDGLNGHYPIAGLALDGAGNLFGTTHQGGSYDQGTIFKVSTSGGGVHKLFDFSGGNGSHPIGNLVFGPDGNLYGTTVDGGINDDGTVYRINPATSELTTLHRFDSLEPGHQTSPEIGIAFDSVGNIYGGTATGVFRLDANTFALHSLNPTPFNAMASGVVLDLENNIYGTGFAPGSLGAFVFMIKHGTNEFSVLSQLDSGSVGGLILDGRGNLFGTTYNGGDFGFGSIYQIEIATGLVKTLASFNGDNGARLGGSLILDENGNLYGTTRSGGEYGFGTVFMLSGVNPVPEPSTIYAAFCSIGATVLLFARRRIRQRGNAA